jgi:hypothetical protein
MAKSWLFVLLITPNFVGGGGGGGTEAEMPIQYVSETPLSKKCIQNSRKKRKSGSFF